MSSKNWKPLLFALTVAISLSACARNEEKAPPASPYTGVWANKDAIQTWRENKNNPNRFCDFVYAWKAKKKVNGRFINLKLNPYVIQTNSEVLLYSGDVAITDAGYRQTYYQGVVTVEGRFMMDKSITSFQALSERLVGNIADRSTFTVDQNRTLLTVNKDGRNKYFWRTEPSEMNDYLAARATCEDLYNQAQQEQAKPGNDRTEEGANNHEDQVPGQNEFELGLGS